MSIDDQLERQVIDAALAWWSAANSSARRDRLVELGRRCGELARARRQAAGERREVHDVGPNDPQAATWREPRETGP